MDAARAIARAGRVRRGRGKRSAAASGDRLQLLGAHIHAVGLANPNLPAKPQGIESQTRTRRNPSRLIFQGKCTNAAAVGSALPSLQPNVPLLRITAGKWNISIPPNSACPIPRCFVCFQDVDQTDGMTDMEKCCRSPE